MPTPLILLLVATLLPLLGSGLLFSIGKRLGSPLAGVSGTIFLAASFVCSLSAMILWIDGSADAGWGMERLPILYTINWLPISAAVHGPSSFLTVGLHLDSLTIVMFATITLVATIVHVFSIGYLGGEARIGSFFAQLGLFCFAMLALVLSSSLLQIYFFWELVGLCSYLLIGFWFQRRRAGVAAMKAFVTNRIGDALLLIGIALLMYRLGDVGLIDLWTRAPTHANPMWLTVAGICLLFGAMAKSAQFPLHTWLPDAMEGPSPVSALIHAATMVAAGVYLAARLYPILTPDARLFIAVIGCITLTIGGLCACVQSDIKRVLAYSTISQLGYMMLGLGVGSWIGGLFHLVTHAFFKALLFLAAGSVIYATHHQQKLRQFGGLWRKMPITALIFAIGVLSISGVGIGGFGFAGYYSKDLLLTHAAAYTQLAMTEHRSALFGLFFFLPLIVSYLTPFYMTRCWWLTFMGKPRDEHVLAAAHETPTLWVPLAVLGVLSVLGGTALGIKPLLKASEQEASNFCVGIDADFDGFNQTWPAELPGTLENGGEVESPEQIAPLTTSQRELVAGKSQFDRGSAGGFSWAIGMLAALILYMNGYRVVDSLLKIPPLRALHTWLHEGMFFDLLYEKVFVSIAKITAVVVGGIDALVVDGIVNMIAALVRCAAFGIGLADRYLVDGTVTAVTQTAQELGTLALQPAVGRVRLYVTVLMTIVVAGLLAMLMLTR